jgi:DNA helicase-2/ATP-dependent DNA helicase PcrA
VFDFLASLNDAQRTAALHDDGPLRILAGAGTGKTTTLSARVARLAVTGTPPERLLLLTFTRRAARSMLARTDALLAPAGVPRPTSGRVVGGTFHAVAHRTLRRCAGSIGLDDGFSVLDTADAADVIDLVREEQGAATTSGRRFPRKATLLDLYSRAVNTSRPLSEVMAETTPWCLDQVEAVAAICRAYVARKRAIGALDFDDLLLCWRAALADDRLGPRLARDYDHVLVDEYQDVNALQVDILRRLRADDSRLTVVGDDAQAIYGFRAATARHILDFPEVFAPATTIVLETNYRSSQQVLDVANALSDEAPAGFTARLHSARPPGQQPELVRCSDEDAQVDAVCRRILDHREAGIALREQAVLVRAAHHSSLLELELSRRRIPYVKYGGLRFLEAAHVKDLVCAFRLADNPRDELAWFRLLQLLDGVGPATARRALTVLGVPGETTEGEVFLRWPLAGELLPARVRGLADGLVAALPRRNDDPVAAHGERVRRALVPLVEARYPDAPARLADLDALVAAAAGAARLSDVAADLALEPPHSTSDLAGPPLVDDDWLVVSTIHSAKGLEWDVVHLLNAADGNIPSDMSLSSRDGLEEERRLLYVAVTRPRRALHVYVPLRFHHRPRGRDDTHTYAQPSRFLTPAVRAHLDEVQAGPLYGVQSVESVESAEPLVPAARRVQDALDALWT